MPLETDKNKKAEEEPKVVTPETGKSEENKKNSLDVLNDLMSKKEEGSNSNKGLYDSSVADTGGVALSESQREEMNSYEFTNEERTEAIQEAGNAEEILAEKQDNWDKFGRAIVGGGYKGGLGAAKMIFDLADINDISDENAVSQVLGRAQERYDEYNAIYDNPDGEWNAGWWARGLQGTLQSAATFIVPGGLAGKLTSGAIRLAGARGVVAEGLTRLTTAAVMNQMETQMMALEMHKDMMTNLVDYGYSRDEAEKITDDKVGDFMMLNRAMIVPEIIGLGSITGVPLVGGIKQGAFSKAKKIGLEMGSEAIEEIYGDGVQNMMKQQGLRQAGAVYDDGSSEFSRATHWLKKEGWESGFWGLAGGPLQQGGRRLVQFGLDKATGRADYKDFPEPPKFSEKSPTKPNEKEPEVKYPTKRSFVKDGETMVSVNEARGPVTYTEEEWNKREKQIEEDHKNENAELIKEWEDYYSELDPYLERKKENEKLQEEWKAKSTILRLRELTGTKKQAKDDVVNFLEEQGSLESKWQDAIDRGDKIAQDDILSRKMEGMFLRYAEHGEDGDGKGSVERLEQALDVAVEDGAENAVAAREKVAELRDLYEKAYKRAYRTQDASVARAIAREVLMAESGMNSTGKLLTKIDQEIERKSADLINNAITLHPGKQVGEQSRLKSKQVEASSLGAILDKTTNSFVRSRIKNKIKQLEASIKEDEKNLTEKISESDFDQEALDDLVRLSEQKAGHFAAYQAYKDKSVNMRKANYFKNRREEKEVDAYKILKETETVDELDVLSQMISGDKTLTFMQKQSINSAIKAKRKEAKAYEEESEKKREEYKKREEAIRVKKNELQKKIREYYRDTSIDEDGFTKSQKEISSLKKDRFENIKKLKESANNKQYDKINNKIKKLLDKQKSLEERIRNRRSNRQEVELLEASLVDLKDQRAELMTSSLSPFSDSIKNNPTLKRALHKLVTTGKDLTLKEITSLMDLPGTNEKFKEDMKRRVEKIKAAENTVEVTQEEKVVVPENKVSTIYGEKVEKEKVEEVKEINSTKKESLEKEKEKIKASLSAVLKAPTEVKDENSYDGPNVIEQQYEKASEETYITQDGSSKPEDIKKKKGIDLTEEKKENGEKSSTTVEDRVTENEVEYSEEEFIEQGQENEIISNGQVKIPTSFNVRQSKIKSEKKLLGGTIWLSHPKYTSEKTNQELKMVEEDGVIYWTADGVSVKDYYYKDVVRDVFLPFQSEASYDLANGEGSYKELLKDLKAGYLYTTKIAEVKDWNSLSSKRKGEEMMNPVTAMQMDPNDSKIAISIAGTYSMGATKKEGNIDADFLGDDIITDQVNSIVMPYTLPDGSIGKLPLRRSKISPSDAKSITDILRGVYNKSFSNKFSMKEYLDNMYEETDKFEGVTVREALNSMVSIVFSTDDEYSGPNNHEYNDKVGNSALYIKYNDNKNLKQKPVLYIRDHNGDEVKYDNLSDESQINEIEEKLSSMFLTPAHLYEINKKVKGKNKSKTIRNTRIKPGDSWNTYLFNSGALTTEKAFAQPPRKDKSGTFAHGEMHGGSTLSYGPITSDKEKIKVNKIQKEDDIKDKVYMSIASVLEKQLSELC